MVSVLPLWPAYLFTVVLFVAIAIGSLLVPRDRLLEDAPDRAGWRDIRVWSVTLVAVQLGLYWVFS
ncbi:MAG: hypothetical protein RIC56_09820 [Pseudomonadales bacterium]